VLGGSVVKGQAFASVPNRAYIAAGGARNGAGQSACRLSKRADVHARIAEILREREHINAASTELAIVRAAISKESLILELAKIGFADIDPRKAKVSDKTAALMSIAKMLGWIVDRQAVMEVDDLEKLTKEEFVKLLIEGDPDSPAEKEEKKPLRCKPSWWHRG
jgi:hypothetical protein